MKFVYDNTINAYCWNQLNAHTRIFGEEKRTEEYPVDRRVVRRFMTVWKPGIEKKFRIGIRQIFGVAFPEKLKCYINSTSYSMEAPGGISISAGTPTPIRVICHEANHVMFRKSNFKKEYFPRHDMEDAKEIFTIVNNIYFQDIMERQDIGWKKFWKERYVFLLRWIKLHPDLYFHRGVLNASSQRQLGLVQWCL